MPLLSATRRLSQSRPPLIRIGRRLSIKSLAKGVCFITHYSVCSLYHMQQTRRPRPSEVSTGRFVSAADVDRAADALLRDGQRPTIEKVRQKIGRGSPNTINPLLDQWWSRLAGRLDAGPAALHRLPEPVAQAAESLWLAALEESRRRVYAETRGRKSQLEQDRQDLAVQTHVLAIRESELNRRISEAERRAEALTAEVQALTTLLRKEQASRLVAEQRLSEPAATPPRRRASTATRKPTRASAPAKLHKRTRKTARPLSRPGRKLPLRNRSRPK